MEDAHSLFAKITSSWQECHCQAAACTCISGRKIYGKNKKPLAHLINLKPTDREFKECVAPFLGTELKPVSVARVQNRRLAKRYATAYAELLEHADDASMIREETDQFHCTSSATDKLYAEGNAAL